MPPKAGTSKADNAVATSITGFDARETKLLAAAFISQIGPDKFDYELMASLTGNTAGSLKKMVPPVKRKATDQYPSLSTFLGTPSTTTAAPIKAPAGKAPASRKRKNAADADADADADAVETEADAASPKAAETSEGSEKKKPKARGRPKKMKDALPEEDHDVEA